MNSVCHSTHAPLCHPGWMTKVGWCFIFCVLYLRPIASCFYSQTAHEFSHNNLHTIIPHSTLQPKFIVDAVSSVREEADCHDCGLGAAISHHKPGSYSNYLTFKTVCMGFLYKIQLSLKRERQDIVRLLLLPILSLMQASLIHGRAPFL